MSMWTKVNSHPNDPAYSVMRLAPGINGMAALREMFPRAEADAMNFVLFSTSGTHGSYNLIEDAERHLLSAVPGETSGDVTFVIVRPREASIRYGVAYPMTFEDIEFLKALRASSWHAAVGIGRAGGG